ncbi:MAG: hypothetical protein KF819_38680, partial [Labilithrix sp.]|nr:hypothetical protein [Labilithrix sp.]
LGTPGFMSPEQAVGNRAQIDAQTDIWAVGATLFTLISGEPVHAGTSAAELLVAAANYPARSLATVTSGISRRLVEVVDRAVAFHKADRWPNARSMQLALRGATLGPISGQVSRRSIPDEEPTFGEIEELDASELVEMKASASWHGVDRAALDNNDERTLMENDERTLMVDTDAPLPKGAMPSSITRPHPSAQPPKGGPTSPRVRHAADNDGPTLAVSSPTTDPSELSPRTEPPQTPQMMQRSSVGGTPAGPGRVLAPDGSGTLIMESSAALAEPAPTTAPKPFGQPPSQAAQIVPPMPQYGVSDPRVVVADGPQAVRGEELMFVAGPAKRPPARGAGSPAGRVLVFVGVALVTMVVVIVTGLLVLAASD